MLENAWVERDIAAAAPRSDAESGSRGTGFRLAVKATVAVQGAVLSAGCPVFADHTADVDASIVAALRPRGGHVVGTTHCHELAFGITGANAWLGAGTHPTHPDRSPGGSSGGSAAVVATRQADLAIGTDTGGSVSIPASVCGVVGFRPTVGRYPADGIVRMTWTRDTAGLFGRSVETIRTADAWITDRAAPQADSPRPGRVAVPAEFTVGLDERTEAAWRRALDAVGVEWDIVPVSLADVLAPLRRPAWQIVGYESRMLFAQFAAAALNRPPEQAWQVLLDGVVTPDVAEALRRSDARPVAPAEYGAAREAVFAARTTYDAVLAAGGCHLMLFPTTPRPATRLVQDDLVWHRGDQLPVFALMTRHTAPGTLLRAPMLTLPVPVASGDLPVGVTVQGLPGDDDAVLAAGALVQGALAGAAPSAG